MNGYNAGIRWRGTFKESHDCQTVGTYLSCYNFEFLINKKWWPVDWNRLREFDRILYSAICKHVREELKKKNSNYGTKY